MPLLLILAQNRIMLKLVLRVYSSLCKGFLFRADLFVGKNLQLPNFRETTLSERGTVQMLTLARDTALEVQVCFSISIKL